MQTPDAWLHSCSRPCTSTRVWIGLLLRCHDLPFSFLLYFSAVWSVNTNKAQRTTCSLNKNKWKIVVDRCCCRCPTERTTAAVLEYLPAIMTNEGWLLPRVHRGHQSLLRLPVTAAVSRSSSALVTKHLRRTPQALAKRDEKMNTYEEDYVLEQSGGRKTIPQI